MLDSFVGLIVGFGLMAGVMEQLPQAKGAFWPRRLLNALCAALTFRPLPCKSCGRYTEDVDMNEAAAGLGFLLFSSDRQDGCDFDNEK